MAGMSRVEGASLVLGNRSYGVVVLPPGLGFTDAADHRKPLLPQVFHAAAAHIRIGVQHGDDHLLDAGFEDFPCTGGGAAEVVAGFQGDEDGRPPGGSARVIDGVYLGVGLPGGVVVTPADDPAVLHDHGADHGIGGRAAPAFFGEGKGLLHELAIRFHLRRPRPIAWSEGSSIPKRNR